MEAASLSSIHHIFLNKKCKWSEVELDSNLNFELAIIHPPSKAWLLILKGIIEGIHQSLIFKILQNATILCFQFSSRLIVRSSSIWSSFLEKDLNYINIFQKHLLTFQQVQVLLKLAFLLTGRIHDLKLP